MYRVHKDKFTAGEGTCAPGPTFGISISSLMRLSRVDGFLAGINMDIMNRVNYDVSGAYF